MRWPSVMVGLALAAGIVAGDSLALPLLPLFALTLFTLASSLCLDRWGVVVLLVGVMLAGLVRQRLALDILSPHDLRLHVADRQESLGLRGRLFEPVMQRSSLVRGRERIRSETVLELTSFRRGETWYPGHGRVLVIGDGDSGPGFYRGADVEVEGLVRPPNGPVGPGLLDYRAFLARRGIHYQMLTGPCTGWRLLEPAARERPPPWSERFCAWARANLAVGLPEDDQSVKLLWAMTLGWKAGLTDEVSEVFLQSGTMHVFAISGLHIMLIAGILVHLLRWMQWPRAWCGLVVLPCLWFYTAATGWQASAIRSALMMTVVVGGWALRRPGELVNSIGAAACLILLWDPQQLFQAGFQLSFAVVFAIAILVPPVQSWVEKCLAPEPLLPPELQPRWKAWATAPLRMAALNAATSVAATAGSFPLVAYYFNLVTPASLVTNLAVVPLSSLALMAALGSLGCGDWLPLYREWLNHAAWAFMGAMVRMSAWSTEWPGAFRYVQAPPWSACAAFYAAGLFLLLPAARKRLRRAWVLAALTAAAGLLAAAIWRHERQLELGLLALEGGQAILVDAPSHGEDLLVDGGDARNAEFLTIPFLRTRGIDTLASHVFTHGDARHMGGWTWMLTSCVPRTVWLNPARFRSPAYRGLSADLAGRSNRFHVREATLGSRVAGWEVVHPGKQDTAASADDVSLGLYRAWAGIGILVALDLSDVGASALVHRLTNHPVHLLITSPCAKSLAASDFLATRVKPDCWVIVGSNRAGAPGMAAAQPGASHSGPDLTMALGYREAALLEIHRIGGTLMRADGQRHAWRWRVGSREGGVDPPRVTVKPPLSGGPSGVSEYAQHRVTLRPY